MKYVCDAPDRKSWFRIEAEAEAERESTLMDHAVAKYFRRERETAIRSYNPTSTTYFEQDSCCEYMPGVTFRLSWAARPDARSPMMETGHPLHRGCPASHSVDLLPQQGDEMFQDVIELLKRYVAIGV